jgi:hypothetical protein
MFAKSACLFLLLLPAHLVSSQHRFDAGLHTGVFTRILLLSETDFRPSGITERSGAAPGYRLGADVAFRLHGPWSIRTGFGWQSTGLRHLVDGLRFGTDQGGTVSQLVNSVRLHSLAVPVDLVRQIPTANAKLNYRAGLVVILATDFRTRSESLVRHTNIPDEQLRGGQPALSPFSCGGGLFLGLEWVLSDQSVLVVEPGCRAVWQSLRLYPYETPARISVEPGLTTRLRLLNRKTEL